MQGFLEHLDEADKSTDNKKVPSPNDKGSWRKETPWHKAKPVTVDKSGAVHTPMSKARHLARLGLNKMKAEEVEIDEAKDIEHHRAELKKAHDEIERIVKTGGRVGLNDPLTAKLKHHAAKIKKLKEEAELTEAGNVPSHSIKHVMRKIKDGHWEAMNDVKPGKHVDIRNTTTNKRQMIHVKEETELDEGVNPSEVAGNPKMYNSDTVKKAYYHKNASESEKESLAKHLDRHHGSKEWRKPVKEETEAKSHVHRVAVTVSDPGHTAVTQRDAKHQKFIRVTHKNDNKDEAMKRAQTHFRKRGWKVHGAEHVGMIGEDTEINQGESNDN